ncbi:hypothetical protein LTS18_014283, partial [Coniosporium uncinatum]
MAAMLPAEMFGCEVEANLAQPMRGPFKSTYRITMAAIDPTAESTKQDGPVRSTLKIIRVLDEEDDDDEDDMLGEDDEDDMDDDDIANIRARLAAAGALDEDDEDEEDDEEDDDEDR